ncbi:MAG: triose-phosphate isomerase [Chloroflexota bacterium]|nr:triose-phosphate isomerase [Chloroflexota bacterium]
MRRPMIAGNWKMNTDPDSAFELMDSMLEDLDAFSDIDIVICPPFVSIETFADLFDGTSIYLGAQNMHWEPRGAFTGEISPLMLQNRCDYVILGHSERRHYFHETDENVRRKVEAALRHDLRPIVCVGESLSEYEAGDTWHVVSRQVGMALDGLDMQQVVIAYEPVWAIGTGKAATGEIANEVIGQIREKVRRMHGDGIADETRILYGGSVNGNNIGEFVSQPEIDGALVGGASLDAEQFVRIVAVTNDVRNRV